MTLAGHGAPAALRRVLSWTVAAAFALALLNSLLVEVASGITS